MDPISILSLAGTIVQFVDFSSKLVSKGYCIYQSVSGALPDNLELEAITTDLYLLNTRLKTHEVSGCLTKAEQSLENLSQECANIADELLRRLEKLKFPTDAKYRKWNSFRQALKTVWNKEGVDEMSARLERLRAQLEFHILVSLKENHDLVAIQQSDRFNTLEAYSRDLVQGLNSNRTIFTNEFKSQNLVISRLHMSMKDHVTNEHIQTRNAIAQALREPQNTRAVVDSPVHDTQSSDRLPIQEAQQYILDSLKFKTMHDRYEAISEAHDKTFNWIFQADMGEDIKWSNYANWLREGEGIYWVNGKAGSGKSTLMRYIVEDRRTRSILKHWAGNQELITTNFFFWKSGAIDQASQLGLLRSLMFEILTIIPSMMPSVFPEEWKETLKILRSGGSRRRAVRQRNQLKRWTLKAIKKGFEILFGQYIGKVCLFIDGLDEYEGDPMDTVELFRSITSSNVKICLSSRPWVVFENAFEERPKLRLQDLTHHDIRLYVDDKLHKDPRMQKLYLSEPEEAPKLISEIVRKADGVFLWVMLVARSLLSGLNNSDQISDLQKRLRLLPSEIEDLYKYMLAQIERIYFEEGSRIFQFMATAYTHEGSGKRNLCAIGVSFAEEPDPSLVFKCRDELLSEVEVQSRVLRVDRRLRICCAGILELSSSDTKEMLQERGNMRVEYIHRTARDFLDTPETRTKILKATEDTGFEPHVALFRSNILLLKTCCFTTSQQWGWDGGAFAEYTMELARAVESVNEQSSIELLDELDRVTTLGWETFKVSPEYDPTDHGTSESDCWVD